MFIITLAISGLLPWLRVYSGMTSAATPEGRVVARHVSARLIDVNGPRVILVLAFPVLVSAVPLFFLKFKISSAILLLLFSLAGSMTVGLFYLPSAVLLFWPERISRA